MITETVIVALISLIGTLVGAIGGVAASSKLINYRLEELEKKVESLSGLIERTSRLEANEEATEKRVDEFSKKLGSIESRVQ